MFRGAFVTLLLALALPRTSFAQAVGYAQATGYFKQNTRPTQYQPLHMLDGREATCWCSSSADPLADTLSFGFKGAARVDEIRIHTGNGFDRHTFPEFSRARKIALRSPGTSHTIELADQRGQQRVTLDPPLEGAQVSLEILDVFPADDPEAPVCLTDVVFVSNGKPLNGPWLTHQLKYDRGRSALLGTWFAGSEGAPDRFLSFFFDGTFRFEHDPHDPAQKDLLLRGDYDGSGSKLLFDTKNGRTTARLRKATKTAGGSAMKTLTVDGAVPDPMRRTFRDRM